MPSLETYLPYCLQAKDTFNRKNEIKISILSQTLPLLISVYLFTN